MTNITDNITNNTNTNKQQLCPHVTDVVFASNELLTRHALNRNFKKLFENDLAIISASNIDSGTQQYNRVLPWESNKVYNKNDLVWFVDFYLPGKETKKQYQAEKDLLISRGEYNTDTTEKQLQEKYYTTTLFLLRSLKNNNSEMPVRNELGDSMIPVFDASGWANVNPLGSIYTDYFEEFTVATLKEQLLKMHEAVYQYHKFGEMKSESDIDKKVLRRDMTNIDASREKIFFPNESYEIPETDTILPGSNVRVWDCGLIEYNIIFKLGNVSKSSRNSLSNVTYSSDGIAKYEYEIISNNTNLLDSVSENRQYYLEESDADIFSVSGGKQIQSGGLIHRNINDHVNSFSGTIEFPIRFANTDYAIFSVQSNNGNNIKNRLVFINKKDKSVTALLIIPNFSGSDSVEKTLLTQDTNIFRCQIIGQYK